MIKAGAVDKFHGLFYAEIVDGRFQVAHSDKTFFGPPNFPMGDKKEALEDLVNKLEAEGWQQVFGAVPSPWYQLTFQRLRAPGDWNTSSMNENPIKLDADSETPSSAMHGMFGHHEPMHSAKELLQEQMEMTRKEAEEQLKRRLEMKKQQ